MKFKILLISLILAMFSTQSLAKNQYSNKVLPNCKVHLDKADAYLNKINIKDSARQVNTNSGYTYSTIANAYMKRYDICVNTTHIIRR